jgi:hypothetical protein
MTAPRPWTARKESKAWSVYDKDGDLIVDNLEERDARLISAAPELETALEDVMSIDYGPFDAEEAWPEEWTTGNEALNKASGVEAEEPEDEE